MNDCGSRVGTLVMYAVLHDPGGPVFCTCTLFMIFLHFPFSWLSLVVDVSSTVDSVRLCIVHTDPSPPCQTQAKGTTVHYLKHTRGNKCFQ